MSKPEMIHLSNRMPKMFFLKMLHVSFSKTWNSWLRPWTHQGGVDRRHGWWLFVTHTSIGLEIFCSHSCRPLVAIKVNAGSVFASWVRPRSYIHLLCCLWLLYTQSITSSAFFRKIFKQRLKSYFQLISCHKGSPQMVVSLIWFGSFMLDALPHTTPKGI